jgi:uncharacterized membrane protein
MIKPIESAMEVHRIVACCTILLMLLVLLPVYKANCQDYIEYKVKINNDNSAGWVVTKVSDVNAPIDTWEGFQTRIFSLVESASISTGREMAIDENSLQINTTISSASKTTEYMFVWQNFSVNSNGKLEFGDVFGVSGFFNQLYGEASLQISYPSTFIVKSVTPEPNIPDDSAHTLKYRTQELANNKVSIILTDQPIENTQSGIPQQYAIIGAVSAIAAVASSIGLYIFKRRKANAKTNTNATLAATVKIESEEDKILNILRASGNAMRQSDITEQCRFSKAKTSQLLAALEKSGVITRYKKGRDKIVTRNERGKGEKY